MTLDERPHIINFSKNDIRYVFTLDDLERPGLFLQVKLLYGSVNTTPATVLQTFDLKPASDGKVYLYIQAYLDSLLNWVVPASNFTNANDQARYFFIHYREITDADIDGDWTTTEEDDYYPRKVIKGGIEKHKNARNNFFINYFPDQKPFLTWQPSGRFVFRDENIYLSFLNTNISTGGYYIRVTAYNTAGTGVTYIVAIPELHALIVHIKADPAALSIASHLSGQIHYYDVAIQTNLNIIIANYHRFYIEYRPAYYYYDLLYHNSIGGFDGVRVRAAVDETFDRSLDENAAGFNLNDWTDKVKMHEDAHTGITVRRTYKGDVGYRKTKADQSALVELLVSTAIYQKIGYRWVPLLALMKSQDLGFNSDKIRSFPIEWSLSESNEVYTPIELNFGEGAISSETDPTPPTEPECEAITTSAVTLPDGQFGVEYFYSVSITAGSAPITKTINDKPDWMSIEIVGDELQYTGTPDTAGEDINVSVTLTNCDGPLDIADTIDIADIPALTFSDKTSCVAGSPICSFHINGPEGTVIGVKLNVNGTIDSSIAAGHSHVTASGQITAPSNDGSANIAQVWSVPGQPYGYSITSDDTLYLTIPGGGVLSVTTICNIENGGTFINATFYIVSINGIATGLNTAVCAGYSTS